MRVYQAKDVEVYFQGKLIKGFSPEVDIVANGDPTDQVTFGGLEKEVLTEAQHAKLDELETKH